MTLRGHYEPKHTLAFDCLQAPTVVVPMADQHGGLASAIYRFHERRASSGKAVYRLVRIEEFLPPMPPQLRSFDNDSRLPMMKDGAFSVSLEAERRHQEWIEWETAAR